VGDDGGRVSGILQGLAELASRLGIEVRVEPFGLRLAGKGGLCRIGNRRVILVDAGLSHLEQAGVIGEALGKVVPPGFEVPDQLWPYLRTGHAHVAPLLRPRPLASTSPTTPRPRPPGASRPGLRGR